jgi:hypothetical protein
VVVGPRRFRVLRGLYQHAIAGDKDLEALERPALEVCMPVY